jgi:HK97 family phage major capsid protein
MRARLDKAEKENRDLSAEEQGRFETLKTDISAIEMRIAQREALDELERNAPAVPGGGGETRAQTLGEQAAASPEVRSFLQANARGSVRLQLQAEQRAVTNLSVVEPDQRPGIVAFPRPRLFLRDLLPTARTTSDSIRVVREMLFVNNAAPVMESDGTANSGVKPESDLQLGLYDAPVEWIAHVLTVSRQALDDVDQLRTFLDIRMRDGLRRAEEAQFLSGDGVSPNLQGLVGVATAYNTARNKAGDKRTDVIHHAIAQLADIGVAASGIVLNLADWMAMVEQKDSNGQYLSQGPFGTVDQPRLWGLPVAASPAMAAGTFLIGDFQQAATIFDRMAPEVLLSTEHLDYFRRNLVLVRSEERVALAISVPQAMVTGSFGAITA